MAVCVCEALRTPVCHIVRVHMCVCMCSWRCLLMCVTGRMDVRVCKATHDASVRKGAVLQGVHMILYAAPYILCWGLCSYMNASVCVFMHVHGKTTA